MHPIFRASSYKSEWLSLWLNCWWCYPIYKTNSLSSKWREVVLLYLFACVFFFWLVGCIYGHLIPILRNIPLEPNINHCLAASVRACRVYLTITMQPLEHNHFYQPFSPITIYISIIKVIVIITAFYVYLTKTKHPARPRSRNPPHLFQTKPQQRHLSYSSLKYLERIQYPQTIPNKNREKVFPRAGQNWLFKNEWK